MLCEHTLHSTKHSLQSQLGYIIFPTKTLKCLLNFPTVRFNLFIMANVSYIVWPLPSSSPQLLLSSSLPVTLLTLLSNIANSFPLRVFHTLILSLNCSFPGMSHDTQLCSSTFSEKLSLVSLFTMMMKLN